MKDFLIRPEIYSTCDVPVNGDVGIKMSEFVMRQIWYQWVYGVFSIFTRYNTWHGWVKFQQLFHGQLLHSFGVVLVVHLPLMPFDFRVICIQELFNNVPLLSDLVYAMPVYKYSENSLISS